MPKKLIIGIVAGVVLLAGIGVGVFFFLNRGGSPAFEDVPKNHFYYKPVQWAEKNGIISGMFGDFFAPDEPCTRGQAMTFLWRASGSPEPSPDFRNPFPDISPDMSCYDAVLWAAERRITRGTDEGGFYPDGAITRGQAMVFLYRADAYTGELRGSEEGAVKWVPLSALTEENTARGFMTSLPMFTEDALQEQIYREDTGWEYLR